MGLDSGLAYSTQKVSTNSIVCKDENGDLQKASLYWIEVNEVTQKLTDGVMERVPASHGQWGGFNTERGIAWAIEIGWPFKKTAWFARYRDVCYGPTDSETAKQAAVAFTKGAPSFPDQGLATTFTGPIDFNADPILAAEMRTQRRVTPIEFQPLTEGL